MIRGRGGRTALSCEKGYDVLSLVRDLKLPFLLMLAASAACFAPGAELDPHSGTAASEPPLLVVDGESISRSEVDEFIRLRTGEASVRAGRLPDAALLEELVVERLLQRRCQASEIEVSAQEVDEQVGLVEGGQPSAELRQRLERYLAVQKLIRKEIGPSLSVELKEVMDYYNRHSQSFRVGDRVHLFEILSDDRVLLEGLRSQLKSGELRSFKESARLHSMGVAAEKGGDLGVFERGELPQEFERTVFALKAGEISQVFHSTHGFHLFMAAESIPNHHQKFHEVQGEIVEKLLAEKERLALDRFLKQIVRDASIQINDERLQAEWRKRDAGTSE